MPRRKNTKRGRKGHGPGEDKKRVESKMAITPIVNLFTKEELEEVSSALGVRGLEDGDCLVGAVVLSKVDVLKKLLNEGHSIDRTTRNGNTALMISIERNNLEMAEFLVGRKANLDLQDGDGNTALLVAVQAKLLNQEAFLNYFNLMRRLPFNINHQNKKGYTALHHAVRRQWNDAVTALLEAGAAPNSGSHLGVTAIMMASSRLQGAAMTALLAHSADPLMEDQKGCTAFCYAAAFVVQKRLKQFDPVLSRMTDLLRSGSLRMSLKAYLQRRLELLNNPPVEKYESTVGSVIKHIFTFFFRFVEGSVAAFLQLNLFQVLRNIMEKHMERIGYTEGLLGVLTETVRQCECCTSLVTSDDVMTAFNVATLPALCLRLSKRFLSVPDCQEKVIDCFIPIFLTCGHPLTKLWIQTNYKRIKPIYEFHLQNCASFNKRSFYPDDNHGKIVENCFLEFKSLMFLLECGSTIQHGVKLVNFKQEKSKCKKVFDHTNFRNLSKSKVKLKINVKENRNKLNSGLAQSKKNISVTSVTDQKEQSVIPSFTETFPSNSDSELTKAIVERTNSDKTVYPKWEEEFKDGCKLFGITTGKSSFKKIQDIEPVAKNEKEVIQNQTVFYLDELFLKLAQLVDVLWQCDFSNGYLKCRVNESIPEFLKLMYSLPNMETYYWIKLSENWKCLTNNLKVRFKGSGAPSTEGIVKCLNNALESIYVKYNLPREVRNCDILKELSTHYINQCFDDGLTQGESYTSLKEENPTFDLLLRNLSDNLKAHVQTRELRPQKYHVNNTNKQFKNTENNFGRGGKCLNEIAPPPGFPSKSEFMENRIFEETWRQVRFCSDKHERLVNELETSRLDLFKHSLLDWKVILPKECIEKKWSIGHGGSLGPVILGLDPTTAKPLAVKRISMERGLGQKLICNTLCRRMRVLQNLQAKVILPYTHCVLLESSVLFGTPLCQANLQQYLRSLKEENTFTRTKARSLVKQTLRGLHFLHTQTPAIVHGNLKPNNIFIDASGQLRLAEFGIYEVLYQDICPSKEASMWWSKETYYYYQASWEKMINLKSDIQVCGMICHYILSCGYHPFGLDPEEVVKGVLSSTARLRLEEPEDIDLVTWMIASMPSRRPTIQQAVSHIFNWSRNKKWQFLLTCSGVTKTRLQVVQLHDTIDSCAQEETVNIDWINKNGRSTKTSCKKISDFLQVVRSGLPHSAKWFLPAFPRLPFVIYRILENTCWILHPEFAPFYRIYNLTNFERFINE